MPSPATSPASSPITGTRTLTMTVYASLFAALIAAGAFIAIPIGPVPIVLQNFFVLLAGLLLGPRWGMTCVAVYLLAGSLGLPVFAGGTGGLGRFAGPTGGYLVSYLFTAWIVGFISSRGGEGRRGFVADLAALIVGAVVVYAIGVPWLKAVTGMDWTKAVMVGMVPFLPGDAVKVAAAIPVARALRPVMAGRLSMKEDSHGVAQG